MVEWNGGMEYWKAFMLVQFSMKVILPRPFCDEEKRPGISSLQKNPIHFVMIEMLVTALCINQIDL